MSRNKTMLSKVFNAGAVNTAAGAFFGYMDYSDSRAQGKNVTESLAGASIEFILPEIMSLPMYLGYTLAPAVAEGAMNAYESTMMNMRLMDKQSRNVTPFRSNTFVDGPQIYTMRQAGMALAQKSKYQLQQTMMGNEARYLHR